MIRKNIVLALVTLSAQSLAYAASEAWVTDFAAAQKQAAAENKSLFLEFTGSDWCPPCQDFHKRILSTEEFATGAQKDFVLVKLDFPQDKSKISDETAAQNQALAKKYDIEGYPTIILTDAQGRPYAQTGHFPGTTTQFLGQLTDLGATHEAINKHFVTAEKAEGVEKAQALHSGLQEVPTQFLPHYDDVIKEIIALDPEDQTGLQAAETKRQEAAAAQAALQKELEALQGKLTTLMEAGKIDESLKLIDEFAATETLETLEKQQILAMKVGILIENERLDQVGSLADQIIALDPEGEFSAQVIAFKENQLPAMLAAAAEAAKKSEN